MTIEGVDYAWGGPSPAALKAAGKKFVVRYGGPGSGGKQLHAAELAALRAAGIDVVANAEGAAGGLRGRAAGRTWAIDAKTHFASLGMPAGRPIYFSADWDVQPSDYADLDAALRGAAEIIGPAAVGIYGSYRTIEHCKAAGTAVWFWQTYAWSGGRQPTLGTNLYQYRNGVKIDGADCDLDLALTDDYGQWGWRRPPSEEEDVSILDSDIARFWNYLVDINVSGVGPPNMQPVGSVLRYTSKEHHDILAAAMADRTDEAAIAADVLSGLSPDLLASAMERALAAGGLTAEALAAAIPATVARQVVDEIDARLSRREP